MGKYQCENCGYETEHNGAYNLHRYHCNMRKLAGNGQKKEQPKHSVCEHEWRLLSHSQPIELRAIQNGYKEVCEKCQIVQ